MMEISKNARKKNESFWDTIHNEKLAQENKVHQLQTEKRKRLMLDTKDHNVQIMSQKRNQVNNDGLREKLDDASQMKQ